MLIHLILVPYDSGRRDVRMGAGPASLAPGLTASLIEAGCEVEQALVEVPTVGWHAEVAAAFALANGIAHKVDAARARGAFPIVLSGNCFATVGVAAGLGKRTGVVWFDAHADFHTPETSTSGFLDGMALRTLTGEGWEALREKVSGFTPVPERATWLVGARDLDPAEVEALERSRVHRVSAAAVSGDLGDSIRRAADEIDQFAIHLDLDVIDVSEGRANPYAVEGGVSAAGLVAACTSLGRVLPLGALTVSAYDPACDTDRRIRSVAGAAVSTLIEELAARAAA